MSVEELREAAALIRERAEAATPGPWEVLDSIHRDPYIVEKGRGVLTGGSIALCTGRDDYGAANCAHIASWHPAVALAVADLLEDIALGLDMGYQNVALLPFAERLAHAYLGTPDRSRPGLGTAGAQPDEPASQAGRPVAGGGL